MRKLFLSIIALTLGEEHPDPAVKVTKGDKKVILYLPDKWNTLSGNEVFSL